MSILYQKLLMGNKPYFVSVSNVFAFVLHRHHEIELSYCLSGTYEILCENKRYTLSEGDLALIPPMAAHGIPEQDNTACQSMTIELGYILLGDYFDLLISQIRECRILRREAFRSNEAFLSLTACLLETAQAKRMNSAFHELFIKGNLYKMSGLLFHLLEETNAANSPVKKLIHLQNVDQALETIYNKYNEPLDIASISASCGYSKSNFCKIFKDITGDTFHNILNRHRIEIACHLLQGTSLTIEEIALETGFSDSKSFCRVFRKFQNMSAGEYRKKPY